MLQRLTIANKAHVFKASSEDEAEEEAADLDAADVEDEAVTKVARDANDDINIFADAELLSFVPSAVAGGQGMGRGSGCLRRRACGRTRRQALARCF